MASDVRKDTTDVYRYKITRSGVHLRDGYRQRRGEAYEEISYRGYYMVKQSWTPWVQEGDTLKLELQQLVANEGGLRWATIRTKIYGGDEDDE